MRLHAVVPVRETALAHVAERHEVREMREIMNPEAIVLSPRKGEGVQW